MKKIIITAIAGIVLMAGAAEAGWGVRVKNHSQSVAEINLFAIWNPNSKQQCFVKGTTNSQKPTIGWCWMPGPAECVGKIVIYHDGVNTVVNGDNALPLCSNRCFEVRYDNTLTRDDNSCAP